VVPALVHRNVVQIVGGVVGPYCTPLGQAAVDPLVDESPGRVDMCGP